MKKRFATLLTAFSLIVSSSTVFGQQITTQPEAPIDVPVSADIASTYVITLPVNIEIGDSREAAYNVAVSGDVTQNTVISVAPESTFDLTSDLRTVTASVVQNKTEWDAADCESGIQENGTISATGLKAGHWTGSLIFDIAITILRDPGLYNADWQLVTPWDQLVSDGVITVTDNVIQSFYYGTTGNLVISNSVTGIGASAFSSRNLTSIEIPNSVTSIGNYAFANNSNLTSITLPRNLTSIGSDLFYGDSGLTSITIPDGVTSIGARAFYGCSKLTTINIPDGVTNIGNSAFSSCSKLSSISIPDGVTSIGDITFQGCQELTSITIPIGVSSIGEQAFIGCSNMTDFRYSGSKEQWGGISLGNMWNAYSAFSTVHCSDGDVTL